MAYIVKITNTNGHNRVVEKAGLRGERTILSISNKTKTTENRRPKKLSGWQTINGAEKFIAEDKKTTYGQGWITKYEIISDDMEMFYDYLNKCDDEFSAMYGFSKKAVNFELN